MFGMATAIAPMIRWMFDAPRGAKGGYKTTVFLSDDRARSSESHGARSADYDV